MSVQIRVAIVGPCLPTAFLFRKMLAQILDEILRVVFQEGLVLEGEHISVAGGVGLLEALEPLLREVHVFCRHVWFSETEIGKPIVAHALFDP